jgi:hypothetical protein
MVWPYPLLWVLTWLRALVVAAPALVCCAATARCEVSVEGTVAALRIKAEQAPLAEVLSALEARLGVRHSALIALDDVTVAGTYSGTLEDVLTRLLSGLNYVIETRQEAIEIVIVSRPGAMPPPFIDKPPPAPANANPAAQWRAPKRQP